MRTAKIAQAFGCEVYAYSRTKKEVPGITYVDLDTLLAACDIISLHVPPIASDHPLLLAPHTLMTPHVAFATQEALWKRAMIVFDNVKKYLEGMPQNEI